MAMTVSAVIPAYNARRFIVETLESVLVQSRPVDEIIVVDDGSTDDTAGVIRRTFPSVRLIQQSNAGVSAARNRGIAEARSEWVALLDADDLWEPGKIARQVELAASPDVVCVHSHFKYVGLHSGVPAEGVAVTRGDYSLNAHLKEWLVNTSTAMFRRAVAPRFRTEYRDGEDSIFFAELSLLGHFAYCPEPLAAYRKHGTSQSDNPWSIVRSRRNFLLWIEEMRRHTGGGGQWDAARDVVLADIYGRLRMARYRRRFSQYLRWSWLLATEDRKGAYLRLEPTVLQPVIAASRLMPARWVPLT